MSLLHLTPNELIVKELQEINDRSKETLDLLDLWQRDKDTVCQRLSYLTKDRVYPTLILKLLTLAEEYRELAAELGSPWITTQQRKIKLNSLIKEKERELQQAIVQDS